MTDGRMRRANYLLATALTSFGWEDFKPSSLLSSRQNASWDGLHFLQLNQMSEGAAKVVAMTLVHAICINVNSACHSTSDYSGTSPIRKRPPP